MRATPLQNVKKSFEGRANLAAKLAEMVDKQNGDTTTEQVKARLMGLSNQKLLRLYRVEQQVRERFGDKAKMVDTILAKRKEAGLTHDALLRTKLESYTKAHLLDLTRQNYAPAEKKLTPEQKLATKKGKTRQRVLAKLGKKA